MTARSTRLDWLLFLALGFMWGSSYLFIKIGVEEGGLRPFTLIALRLGIGFAVLAVVVALAREPLPREPRMYGHLLVMGVINIVLPFFLITWAEQSVESSLASILNGTVPLFVIVIAALFLRDEPITVNRVVGLVVGFVGVVILTSRGLGAIGASNLGGELALIASAISYAAGNVYARRNVQGLRPMIPAVFQVGFALVITTVLAFAFERPFELRLNEQAIFAVVWLGIFGSALAYLVYFRLLKRWGATRTSLVAYLLPVVGIVLGFLVLSEPVDGRLLVGTALVIGGVALVNSRFGSRRLYGRAGAGGGITPVEPAQRANAASSDR
ncbi:MAG: DMT family transporter [Chloroflexota bacterium]|nr:DMT family transporter [Chloroflexota bacterium]